MPSPAGTVREVGETSAGRSGRSRGRGSGEVRGVRRMEREKMLDVTLAQIEKQYGKGAVMRLGEHPAGQGISVIPTGSPAPDVALGIGGIPPGRLVEVYGPEGPGKTPVCLHLHPEAPRNAGHPHLL